MNAKHILLLVFYMTFVNPCFFLLYLHIAFMHDFCQQLLLLLGKASTGPNARPPCADQEDMTKKFIQCSLHKEEDKGVITPTCWCENACRVKGVHCQVVHKS